MCRHCLFPRAGLRRRPLLAGLLPALLPAAGLACPALPADSLLEPSLRLALPATAPRGVALTLDACDGRTDMRILETLLRLEVPATIFATARWVQGNAAALALLRAHPALFSLQNHGARHLPAVLGAGRVYGLAPAGTVAAVQAAVAGGAAALVEAGLPPPRWYRGATALYSPEAVTLIEAMGQRVAGFSLNADEGASLPAAAVARRIGAARGNEVIIAHLNHPERPSGAGVAAGVAALRAAGMGFVRLDAAPVAAEECRPRHRPQFLAAMRHRPGA
ncbi:MAG: polysaccharide deacetylase family protein [Paracraurococcus sp.]